jgi:anti-sigma factor RsiW
MATRHITDDDLELYALDRLAEAAAAPVEEHLLACEERRARLAGTDVCVQAVRAASIVYLAAESRHFSARDAGQSLTVSATACAPVRSGKPISSLSMRL